EDQPVDRLARAADAKCAAVGADRHDAEIDVGSEAAIQQDLVPALDVAGGSGREVEKVEPHRLEQLPGVLVGEEDGRDVRFAPLDRPSFGKGVGAVEGSDDVVMRRHARIVAEVGYLGTSRLPG